MRSLQNPDIYLKPGSELRLLCAAINSESVNWSFKARNKKTIKILENIGTELLYKHVNQSLHDGVYNCSTSTDYQVSFINTCGFP